MNIDGLRQSIPIKQARATTSAILKTIRTRSGPGQVLLDTTSGPKSSISHSEQDNLSKPRYKVFSCSIHPTEPVVFVFYWKFKSFLKNYEAASIRKSWLRFRFCRFPMLSGCGLARGLEDWLVELIGGTDWTLWLINLSANAIRTHLTSDRSILGIFQFD